MFSAVEIFVLEQSVNVYIYLCVYYKVLVSMCVNAYVFVFLSRIFLIQEKRQKEEKKKKKQSCKDIL